MKIRDIVQKYKKMSPASRSTVWYTACNFLTRSFGFITAPIFTRLLPSDEYGSLAIFLSYEQIILILSTWEIQLGAYQRGIFKFKNEVGQYTASVVSLTNLLTIICFVFIFIFKDGFLSLTGFSSWSILLMFFYLLLQPSYQCWLTRKRTAYQYKAVVGMTLLASVLGIIIPMAAVIYIGNTANIKFSAGLVTSILIYLFFYFTSVSPLFSHSNGSQNLKPILIKHWKFAITFEGPLVVHSLSYLILGQADRIMIGEMVGKSEAAFYSVAYSIAVVISILQSSINQALAPWRIYKLEEKNYSAINKTTNSLLILIGAAVVLFILVAPEVITVLFTQNYHEAIWCIPPVATSMFFLFLYTIFVSIEEYYEKTSYVLIVSIICSVVNIVLNYICIPQFGYISCAYTTLASYILFAILHFAFVQRVRKIKHIEEPLFSGRMVLLISCTVLIISIIVTLLYKMVHLRYIVFVIGCTICFVYRKRIISLFEGLKNIR